MKAYLLDTFKRFKRYSDTLDVKTNLCNKTWLVFNDEGEREVFIFNEDGTMIISCNGLVTNSSWKYIPSNNSIVITTPKQAYMLHPAFLNGIVFALQLDGVEKYSFLITEQNAQHFEPQTLTQLLDYFSTLEEQFLLDEKRKEEERIALLKAEQYEKERKEKELALERLHSTAKKIVYKKWKGNFMFKLYMDESKELLRGASFLLFILLIPLVLYICSRTGICQHHEDYGWLGWGFCLIEMAFFPLLAGIDIAGILEDFREPISVFLYVLTLGPAIYFGNRFGLSDWWSLLTTPAVTFILGLPFWLVLRFQVKKYYSEIEQEFERLKKEKGLS